MGELPVETVRGIVHAYIKALNVWDGHQKAQEISARYARFTEALFASDLARVLETFAAPALEGIDRGCAKIYDTAQLVEMLSPDIRRAHEK
jgi:hypothetical protein